MMKKILKAVEADHGFYYAEGIVYGDYSAAFLDEDDYYDVKDYLDSKNISYKTDKSSMAGIYLIELVK